MKKIILVFSITGICGILNAQQKELFNAEEYLIKKAPKTLLRKKSPGVKNDISGIFSTPNKKIFNSWEPGQIPCIKADINFFTITPNPALGLFYNLTERKDFAGAMPNPAPPLAINIK